MPSGDVQDRPRTDAPRAVRHHLRILVHRLLHGHHHHVRNPAVGGFFFMTVFMLGLAIPYHAGEPRYLNRQLAVGKAGAIVGSFGFLYAVCVTVEGHRFLAPAKTRGRFCLLSSCRSRGAARLRSSPAKRAWKQL
jgi:hypothetical protein